jgi:hypothetical protein
MRRATRQAPSEIADRKFEKSIESLASVGMLAKAAERFRRGEGRDEEVAECRSQAHNGSVCAYAHLKAVTSANGERRRARDERAPSSRAASVGHGAIEDFFPVS